MNAPAAQPAILQRLQRRLPPFSDVSAIVFTSEVMSTEFPFVPSTVRPQRGDIPRPTLKKEPEGTIIDDDFTAGRQPGRPFDGPGWYSWITRVTSGWPSGPACSWAWAARPECLSSKSASIRNRLAGAPSLANASSSIACISFSPASPYRSLSSRLSPFGRPPGLPLWPFFQRLRGFPEIPVLNGRAVLLLF